MSEFIGGMLGPIAQVLGIAQGAAGGALTGLVTQFENAGLTERVRSWIGHGDNLAVTEEELATVFAPEQLQIWAVQAGTSPEALLKVMTEALPQLVDRATPEGKLHGS
jgi:uncharacterized protein YidB (DUF937 family)